MATARPPNGRCADYRVSNPRISRVVESAYSKRRHTNLTALHTWRQQEQQQLAGFEQQQHTALQHADRSTPMLRRHVVQLAVAGFLQPTVAQPQHAQAAELSAEAGMLQQGLRVGPTQPYQTISAAIEAAEEGASISIDPGRYTERLVVQKSLTLAAAQQGSVVEVSLDTQQPYQHCLEVPDGVDDEVTVTVKGLTFRHYSKSVANNYCIFAQSGCLALQGCDISSKSGVGVGVEGAQVTINKCTIHDCERHGIAVFGSLEGGSGGCTVSSSSVSSNKMNGILVRDGGSLTVRESSITGNGEYGMELQDCSVEASNSDITGNRLGAAAVQLESVELDLQTLESANHLDTPVKIS